MHTSIGNRHMNCIRPKQFDRAIKLSFKNIKMVLWVDKIENLERV